MPRGQLFNHFGVVPLHQAAQEGKVEVMRLLVSELGADVEAREEEKSSTPKNI